MPSGDRYCGACGTPLSGSAVLSGPTFDPWAELLQKLRQATIGEYEIRGELGRGGMAAVFLAHDLHLNRKVAIKVMLPGLVFGERMWDRFLAEARTAAKLDHPNIIYIHSVKEKDRFVFFVMKYVDGRALDDLLAQQRPLPIPVAQMVLVEVARALDYAHREGVVHRDIKPANIMIDQKGNSIVMDFGIARAPDTQHFTQTGATIGTPAYMSPEQCHGLETTAASDQYSLGILAYELLSGAAPFKGTPIELQIAHMQDTPKPLRDLRPELSPELSSAVMRMLEKEPGERWPSLQHLVPVFGRGLDPHDEGLRGHLVSLVRSATPRHTSFPATPVSPTPDRVTRSRAAEMERKTPFEARTPVSGYEPAEQRSATAQVNPAELARAAAASAARAALSDAEIEPQDIRPSGGGGAQDQRSSGAGDAQDHEPSGEGGAHAQPEERSAPAFDPGPDLQGGASRRTSGRRMLTLAGAFVVLLAVVILLPSPGSKATLPAPAAGPVAGDNTPAATPSAADAVSAALGDSVVIGHGSDATAKVAGKAPRVVTSDAVAIIQVSFGKPLIAVGDTVHAKIDAFDDAGRRVTTPQMVQATSNPRVVKFAGPGELVALREGKATVTVSAGAATATREVTVGAKGDVQSAKSDAKRPRGETRGAR